MTQFLLILLILLVLLAIAVAVLAGLLWKKGGGAELKGEFAELKSEVKIATERQGSGIDELKGGLKLMQTIPDTLQKGAAEMRTETQQSIKDFRGELENKFKVLQDGVQTAMTATHEKMQSMENQNSENAGELRKGVQEQINVFRGELENKFKALQESVQTAMTAAHEKMQSMENQNRENADTLRKEVQEQLEKMREGNEKKLEQIHETVGEKLRNTLDKRLGESFEKVQDKLNLVTEGLGKMQSVSDNVTGLTKILGNAPARGNIGEKVILESILRQMLTPEQYDKNVNINPDSGERVEFVVNIPQMEGNIMLPVDSKFPIADYESYQQALEKGNKKDARASVGRLVTFIKKSAETIRKKYIYPPYSTDTAILFVPTEGLYALLAEESGLLDSIVQEHSVVVAGPNNFAALLRVIQMGYHLFAVQKNVGEVQKVLGVVKGEFDKFGDVLVIMKRQLGTVSKTVGDAETRTEKMKKALHNVGSPSESDSREVLGMSGDSYSDEGEDGDEEDKAAVSGG